MYSKHDFSRNIRGDIFGGLTAAIVALPLALAFGISSGAGPVAGLYGAIIVGFFAAVFGGTRPQISGPTSPMTVVMTAMITKFSVDYPDMGLALGFTVVMLGGLLQIAFGLLRLGKYIIMVPYPVISGFMSGIGVIIIVLQIAPLLGLPSAGTVVHALAMLPEHLRHWDGLSLALGAATLAALYLWRGKAARIIPSPLFALSLATVALLVSGMADQTARIGEIPSALPSLHLPVLEWSLAKDMLLNALILAILGAIDTLLTSLVADNFTRSQHHSDQELIGQGIGNTLAGIFGGLPGAGATMRTLVNIRAGGSGPLSGAVHALILLAIVLGLGGVFEYIPLAALAAVLIKIGLDIIDWAFLKKLPKLPLFPAALMLLVFVLTVFVDLITAVFVGVFIKNIVTIERLSGLELGGLILSDGSIGAERLAPEEKNTLLSHNGECVLFRVNGPLSYAVGRGLTMRFDQFKSGKLLLIDLTQADIVGISTAMVMEELIKKARSNGTIVKLVDGEGQARPELQRMGLLDLVGAENCIASVTAAYREMSAQA